MRARQRLRLATVPLPLITPQAPGQLSLTGQPVPGEGGTTYSVPRVCECCGYAAVDPDDFVCGACRLNACRPLRPQCGEPDFRNPEGADDTNNFALGPGIAWNSQ